MTILEVYERYKHLDQLLSDPIWVEDNLRGKIINDLWLAIRTRALVQAATQKQQPQRHPKCRIPIQTPTSSPSSN